MNDILAKIREAVNSYDKVDMNQIKLQSEILRKLVCNLFRIEAYRTKAHNEWTDAYHQSGGSNAAKAREADKSVPELYLLRRVMESGYRVTDAIRSTIGVYKKES